MRLDHLLSKEHAPRPVTDVHWRMVVFTSGIVDDHRTRLRLGGQACGSGWLLVASRWWGTGSGTLLGPEESAVMSYDWVEVGLVVGRGLGLLVLPLSAVIVVVVVGVGGVVV